MAWHHLHGGKAEAPDWLKERWAAKGIVAVSYGYDDSFQGRKRARTEHYEKYVKGWKLGTCTACSGSGYYDNTGSPRCGCCDGTGKMRSKPDAVQEGNTE